MERAQPKASFLLKALIFVMFATFAMTTDSVGTVIPEIIREFELGLTAAGAFQYATMSGIGISAILLGFLADRIGRKVTILIGLTLFGTTCALFAAGHSFGFFVALLFIGGLGIGIFKAGALALIGDITQSTRDHARTMNLIEGFFGIGAIVGPAVVAYSLAMGTSWKWLYLFAGLLCGLLVVGSLVAKFPKPVIHSKEPTRASESARLIGDPTAMFFASALMLYVGAEAAIYVWAPTYLAGYAGGYPQLALYVVSIFFVLRAAGRFLGAWLLSRFEWSIVLLVCSLAMALLFWAAVIGGRNIAVFALPATGLFMSVLYPTINSTGISCFDKGRHGAVAGLLLFFTCLSAVIAPLAMAGLSEWLGDISYAMVLGAALATLLAIMCGWNLARAPFAGRLSERDATDYGVNQPAHSRDD